MYLSVCFRSSSQPEARLASFTTEAPRTEEEEEEALLEDEDALEELQTLVDLLLDEEEEESRSENSFQIFLRLSTTPKYLVQGYDFKMLNK